MRTAIVFACVWVTVQALPASRDTTVTSVRASLRPKSAERLRITIENLRESPLLESTFGLFEPGAAHPRSRVYLNFGGYLGGSDGPVRQGSGPIAPHERRVAEIDVPDPEMQRQQFLRHLGR